MVNGTQVRNRLIETINGCDKKCKECVLYDNTRKQCIKITQIKWQEWANKQHDLLRDVLGEIENKV